MRPVLGFFVPVFVCALLASGCQREPRSAEAAERTAASDSASVSPSATNAGRPSAPERLKPQANEYMEIVPPTRAARTIEFKSVAVQAPPTIDGAVDEVWQAVPVAVTLDKTSQREIWIKSVHTADEIFFLASYPDATPSETHKSWVWDPQEQIYKQGPDREDALVFEWSMVGNDVALSTYDRPQPHKADVWFWKAARTNPAGYADDKVHILGPARGEESQDVPAANGTILYLQRLGDEGRSCYEESMLYEYQGDVASQFTWLEPQGSRADVRAKGVWSDGRWTVEFGRKFDTGHADDLAMGIGSTYLFGVSCYETTYDKVHPDWTQPLFRTGDVFDRLLITLAE